MWFVEKRAEISETRSTDENDQIPATSGSAAVKGPPEELIDSLVNFDIADATAEITSSTSRGSGYPDALLSIRDSSSANQVHVDAKRVAKSDLQSEVQGSTAFSTVNSFPEPNKDLSKSEAAAAEAELDMLLDSFTEIKVLDSSGLSSAKKYLVQEEATMAEFQHPRKNPDPSVATTANLDDDLDDLLKETSGLMNKANLFQPQGERGDHFVQSSFSQPETKSKALDDFDSWLDTI